MYAATREAWQMVRVGEALTSSSLSDNMTDDELLGVLIFGSSQPRRSVMKRRESRPVHGRHTRRESRRKTSFPFNRSRLELGERC